MKLGVLIVLIAVYIIVGYNLASRQAKISCVVESDDDASALECQKEKLYVTPSEVLIAPVKYVSERIGVYLNR